MRVLTDSICVRVLCRENVLVAIGNRLAFLYLDANGDTQQTFAAVPRLLDKIHGIVACLVTDSTYQIVFHAGPEVYSTIVDCSTHSFSECTRIEVREDVQPLPVPHIRRRVSDWISSVSLLSPTQLCLLTSHGVAVLLHRSAENPTEWSMIDKCACDDGSTLYCSTLSGQQWERLVFFTGTALGLLLIWRVAGDNRGKVLERISAHNGVIFSIACDFASGLLTTTSDDRSVKFWKIRQCDAKDDTTVVELHEERYCFAHTARVFQCRIIKNAFRCLVATIGEDSHLCLWNREGDLLLKKQLDEGATLWGMDYDPATTTIFVTASNGNLHKYSIKSWMEDSQRGSDIQHMKDISPTLAVGEHLAKIRFIPRNGTLVAVTNKHSVVTLNSDGTVIQSIAKIDAFKCSILDVGGSFLYLAGGCNVQLYKVTNEGLSELITLKSIFFDDKMLLEEHEEPLRDGAIRSLSYCRLSRDVAICDGYGRCLIYDETLTNVLSKHRIPKSPERWITSFAVPRAGYLLLADRSGHFYLYDVEHVKPLCRLSNVHGKLGITSIAIEAEDAECGSYRLTTSGHDGRICELYLSTKDPKLELLTYSKTRISWIDRTIPCDSRRFYLGFNDSHFLMTDERNEICCQFDCGGGHRCWDFFYNQHSNEFTFVFIQHKKLKRVQITLACIVGSALSLPRHKWHTRACNVLRVISRSDGNYLLVSGGEDNILRINLWANGELLAEPRKHIFSHISGIKTIITSALKEDPDRLLVISAGGRAQICLTTVRMLTLGPKQEYEYMLLASDAERCRWKTNRQSSYDPETKFMCAARVCEDRIVFGCSDGFIRIYKISHTDGQWLVELETESFYGRCVLQTVPIDGCTMEGLFVTMATDGYLCFWDITTPNEPIYRHRHHSSGMNSVDVRIDGKGNILLATGGDDQSISVSQFAVTTLDGRRELKHVVGLCEKYLHTAQVTGIKLLSDDRLISAGVDQRIYISSFTGFSSLAVTGTTSTCVADVKGISFISERNELIVYGCGIEIVNLSNL
uniref:tRNA (34-2'-O)-methyltransferase regulator WDR6 n=1 Tax=Anopheles darlingi TaxID=43151 RepID=A0A2M4CU43_ANODA